MTKLPRREFLHLAAGAAALPALSRIARAQAYPTRPVRIVVGFAAGGMPDIPTRIMAQWLSERLGQQFVIENRPGATGNIATDTVVKAAPDGYTLLAAPHTTAWNPFLYNKLNFDFIRDIAPIAAMYRAAAVLVVNPSFPATSVPEFIAYAKANPGKINIASQGNGTTPHLSAELFKGVTGVDFVQVHYRDNASGLASLLTGDTQASFGTISPWIDVIKSGKLRALAVTSAIRVAALPEVPTIGEFLPGYDGSGWGGIGAPRNTPIAIIEKLNKEINAVPRAPVRREKWRIPGARRHAGWERQWRASQRMRGLCGIRTRRVSHDCTRPRLLHLFDVYAYILQIVRIDILDLPVICFLVDNVSSLPHGVLPLADGVTNANPCASYDV
jgi:tripartite-type tricarboxylate transporter receptor subunit TctC